MRINFPSPARLLASAIYAVAEEYRKLDKPLPVRKQEMSCTSAHVSQGSDRPRKAYMDGTVDPPFAVGFGKS